MKNLRKIWIIIALALPLLISSSCSKDKDPVDDEEEIDYTQFSIINNGNGAVTTIDPSDTKTLEIVQTIPSFTGGSSYSSMKSSTVRQSANNLKAITDDVPSGTFPANLPVMFFFNNKLYLNSVKDNVEIIVDGENVKGTIAINEGANGFAILTFTPWKEFKVNKSISVTIKKEIQSKGGIGMLEDVNLLYQTMQGASGNFDGNGNFEKGTDGVMYIGDGSRMQAKAPLTPQQGQWYSAISSGSRLVSGEGMAVGGASSMMILGPINKDITSLNFHYDFISAEFNDYVDSEFDDCAMFTITGPKGSYSEFITSVNTIRFDNKAFTGFPGMPDDGDNYAGHIGWVKREIKFDKVGTPAYVTFTVTDVSDLILSSILAIDNIDY